MKFSAKLTTKMIVATVVLVGGVDLTQAALVIPASYSMPNGYGRASRGAFNYWDRFYSGSGDTTVDGAALSDGLGDLTDGSTASDNWRWVENNEGTGPYVGWVNIDPQITFQFDSAITFETVRIHVDDSNGFGGVSPPASITIDGGGMVVTSMVGDPFAGDPFWVELDVSDLAINDSQLAITLNRQTAWVFASEVEFIATIPEPGSWITLAVVVLLVGISSASLRSRQVMRRRKRLAERLK